MAPHGGEATRNGMYTSCGTSTVLGRVSTQHRVPVQELSCRTVAILPLPPHRCKLAYPPTLQTAPVSKRVVRLPPPPLSSTIGLLHDTITLLLPDTPPRPPPLQVSDMSLLDAIVQRPIKPKAKPNDMSFLAE